MLITSAMDTLALILLQSLLNKNVLEHISSGQMGKNDIKCLKTSNLLLPIDFLLLFAIVIFRIPPTFDFFHPRAENIFVLALVIC